MNKKTNNFLISCVLQDVQINLSTANLYFYSGKKILKRITETLYLFLMKTILYFNSIIKFLTFLMQGDRFKI